MRTSMIERQYGVFRRWAQANRQLVVDEVNKVRSFRKRLVFDAWMKYMQKQGNNLALII